MSWIFLRGQMPALWCLEQEIGWTCMISLEMLLRLLFLALLIICCRKQKRRRPNRINPPSGIRLQIQRLVLSSSLSRGRRPQDSEQLELVLQQEESPLLPPTCRKMGKQFWHHLTLLYFNYFYFFTILMPLQSILKFSGQACLISTWKRVVIMAGKGNELVPLYCSQFSNIKFSRTCLARTRIRHSASPNGYLPSLSRVFPHFNSHYCYWCSPL